MVVDGSKLVRKLIADVLQRDLPGVEVIGCDSIEDAQQALAQGPVDLVTTSLTLRDGDGLALARMVREAAGQAYVPVIVVSGDAQQHLEQRRFTEYVTDYFDKSLGHEALATFIRGYVQPQTIPGATILYIEDSRVVAEAKAHAGTPAVERAPRGQRRRSVHPAHRRVAGPQSPPHRPGADRRHPEGRTERSRRGAACAWISATASAACRCW